MKDSQDKITSPSQPEHSPIPGSHSNGFNDAEYRRWSEKLRNQYSFENDGNQRTPVDIRAWLTESKARQKD